jgi:hypothetical protein
MARLPSATRATIDDVESFAITRRPTNLAPALAVAAEARKSLNLRMISNRIRITPKDHQVLD